MPTLLVALSAPLAALLLAACATSRDEIDLTAHLVPECAVGDFKVFAVDDGTERRYETVRVEPYAEGRYEAEEFRVDGKPVGGVAGVVTPGRERAILVSTAGSLVVSWEQPGLVQPLRAPVGRTLKARASGRAEQNGFHVGSATRWMSATLVGFGACETPVASYPDAARFEESTTFRVEDEYRHRKLEIQVEGDACYAPGIGLVAATERTRTWVDGALLHDTGEVRAHLVSGKILGVPIP